MTNDGVILRVQQSLQNKRHQSSTNHEKALSLNLNDVYFNQMCFTHTSEILFQRKKQAVT